MNCLEYRRTIGAEPHLVNAELQSHARACAACAEFGAQMRLLDQRVAAALRIPVPAPLAAAPAARHWSRAPLAIAASLLVTVALGAILWLTLPTAALADDVIAHMEHEPQALLASEPVPESALAHLLSNSAMRTHGSMGRVTYARSCWFRGHFVPHLVVDEGRGPVTVLLLAHENVARPVHFAAHGFTGVIVPAGRGSIAVLTRDESQVDAIAARLAKVVG